MGSCNCNDRSAEPETRLDLPVNHQPVSQAAAQSSLYEEPAVEVAADLGSDQIKVRELQMAWKGYLDRKRLSHRMTDMLDFPDPPSVPQDSSTETEVTDIIPRLTDPAKATYSRISRLLLDKNVKDVVMLGPRVLTDSGDIYIGQWATRKDGVPSRKGKGKLVTTSGALLEGYWNAGKLHLMGRIIYPNGDFYEGEFFEGIRRGKGRFETYERRSVYIGDWDNDVRQGYGIETFEDGSRYEGTFTADTKTGKGKFTWKDGSAYDGDFVEGRLEGSGVYSWQDGRLYIGEWKGGKMNGNGKFTYKDGKSYEGQYLNDKKHGYGVYKWEGKTYEGEWFQGKMHGFGYMTTSQGRKRYEFRDGNKVREAPE